MAQFEEDEKGKAQLLGNLVSFECPGRREILTNLRVPSCQDPDTEIPLPLLASRIIREVVL